MLSPRKNRVLFTASVPCHNNLKYLLNAAQIQIHFAIATQFVCMSPLLVLLVRWVHPFLCPLVPSFYSNSLPINQIIISQYILSSLSYHFPPCLSLRSFCVSSLTSSCVSIELLSLSLSASRAQFDYIPTHTLLYV